MFKFLKGNIDVSCEDVSDLHKCIAYLVHEIRTPLNSIYGNLALLRMESSPGNIYLDNAVLAVEYLMRLVESTLTVSEMESDTSVIKREAITLEELLEYPKGILEWAAAEKNIELQFLCGETVYQYLYLDRTAIQQIIVNLISNAIKYTNEGGRVLCRITEEYLEEKRIKLFLEVEDTGIGMEEGFVLHIWDESARERRQKGVKGNGFGMPITRRLVELINGNIEIKTRAGHGTKVLVELEADGDDILYGLPRPPIEEGENARIEENIEGYTLPKRALVAEDEEANMEVICKYLEMLGIEADKAYDGDEVIEIFSRSEENRYNVILMDINLPGKSGIEAVRTIRSLDRMDRGVPIFAVTADILDRSMLDILSGEISGYIIKPYRLEDIRFALSKHRWQ